MEARTCRYAAGGLVAALSLTALGAGGGAIAAARIGSRQIADNSVRSRDVRDGTLTLRDLDPAALAVLSGADGLPGPPGTDGVVQVSGLVGPVASILGNSGSYVFAGPSVQLTTTAARPRVTGSATASLGLNAGNPQFADLGLCYQPEGGGPLTNFAGNSFSTAYFTTTRSTYTSAATKVLPPATYAVGMCIRNNGASTINNNNIVNGWVLVTA